MYYNYVLITLATITIKHDGRCCSYTYKIGCSEVYQALQNVRLSYPSLWIGCPDAFALRKMCDTTERP